MLLSSSPSIYKRLGLPRRFRPFLNQGLLWRSTDGLTPTLGPTLTCIRATNTTSLRPDGSYDFVAANALGADHYLEQTYTFFPSFRTSLDTTVGGWTGADATCVDSGVASCLQNINLRLITATAANGTWTSTAHAVTASKVHLFEWVIDPTGTEPAPQFNIIDSVAGTKVNTYTIATDTWALAAGVTAVASRVVSGTKKIITLQYSSAAGAPNLSTQILIPTNGATVLCAMAIFHQGRFSVNFCYPSPEAAGGYVAAATALYANLVTDYRASKIWMAVVSKHNHIWNEMGNASGTGNIENLMVLSNSSTLGGSHAIEAYAICNQNAAGYNNGIILARNSVVSYPLRWNDATCNANRNTATVCHIYAVGATTARLTYVDSAGYYKSATSATPLPAGSANAMKYLHFNDYNADGQIKCAAMGLLSGEPQEAEMQQLARSLLRISQ